MAREGHGHPSLDALLHRLDPGLVLAVAGAPPEQVAVAVGLHDRRDDQRRDLALVLVPSADLGTVGAVMDHLAARGAAALAFRGVAVPPTWPNGEHARILGELGARRDVLRLGVGRGNVHSGEVRSTGRPPIPPRRLRSSTTAWTWRGPSPNDTSVPSTSQVDVPEPDVGVPAEPPAGPAPAGRASAAGGTAGPAAGVAPVTVGAPPATGDAPGTLSPSPDAAGVTDGDGDGHAGCGLRAGDLHGRPAGRERQAERRAHQGVHALAHDCLTPHRLRR